jgi:hypothetical protein
MKNQFSVSNPENQSQTISLKHIVAQLFSQFQPLAVKHRSFIVNDVPADLYVYADKNNLVMIISSLLNSIISRSRRNCIRVSAKRYHNIVLVRLKDSTKAFTHISGHDWRQVNMLAKRLDGCIIENDIRKEHATITFSFCSLVSAA